MATKPLANPNPNPTPTPNPSPNPNQVATKPLWPRVYETFGEDPFVAAQLGAQVVRGIQAFDTAGESARQTPHRAAACLKHFIGYSAPSSGHDRTPVALPDRSLLQYYAPPFAAAIAAGALALMTAP